MPRAFLTKRAEFSVAHRYAHPRWDRQKNEAVFGPAVHLHGHNYLLEVTVAGEVDPRTGMVLNLSELKRAVHGLLGEFDHKNLNEDSPYFAERIPTTEHLASTLWRLLEPQLAGLTRVRLYENPTVFVDYGQSPAMNPQAAVPVTCTRVYGFSAAHRLVAPTLTDEENLAIYGKCSSLHGHGHDYMLEVTFASPAPPDLDRVIAEHVVMPFDHRNLNSDVEEFQWLVPTAEHILIVTWERLVKRLPPGLLCRLKLVETRDNYFEYYG